MAPTVGVNLRVTGHCNQGGRKYMEDCFVVAYQQTEDEKDLEYAYFGIFDGHGGREAALFAKEHLMDHIVDQKNFWSDDDDLVLKAIRDGFITTHMAMWKEVGKWPKTVSGLPSTSGTTSSVAFIRHGKMYIGHVGDSKIVVGYQDPGSKEWQPLSLTKDHKPESPKEKKRIYSVGGLVMNKAGVERVVWNRPRLGHKGPIRRSTHFDQIPFLAVARSLADVNAKDRFDVTAVHMAAEKGHYFCLKALLDAGAECCVPTKYSKKGCYTAIPHPGGTTPLHLAAANNHITCVRELIHCGADYNAVDERGRTSLFIAAQTGFDDCVLAHLRNAIGRDILSLPGYESGDTPLHFAVKNGMIECIAELLNHGSDVNHLNYDGASPLHYAVTPDPEIEPFSKEILRLLVLNGYNTDVNLHDASGLTPLHYVCFSDGGRLRRRPELAAFLIAFGADTNITNQRGYNIIQAEFRCRSKDCIILKAIVKNTQSLPSLNSLNIIPPPAMPPWAKLPPMMSLAFADPWMPPSRAETPPLGSPDSARCHPTPHHGTAQLWARYHWYNAIASNPRSLQHYCRVTIRKALTYKRLRHVKDLPIPVTVQRYLLLDYEK